MNFNDDKHLDVCQNIEVGLKRQYESNPRLTDGLCTLALDSAKIAIKQYFGYAKNENVSSVEDLREIIDWCVAVGLERIEKINDELMKTQRAFRNVSGGQENSGRSQAVEISR